MPQPNQGLPGLRGTDHIGFTVPNLEEAVDFFVNVIGCEAFHELGPLQLRNCPKSGDMVNPKYFASAVNPRNRNN